MSEDKSIYTFLSRLFMGLSLAAIALNIMQYAGAFRARVEPEPLPATGTAIPQDKPTPARATVAPDPRMQPRAVHHADHEKAADLPLPSAPSLKLENHLPVSGGESSYTIAIQECHRAGAIVQCTGKVTNNIDTNTVFGLHGGSAVDDQGNSLTMQANFPNPNVFFWGMNLLPGVPAKFVIVVQEEHQSAKSLNLILAMSWHPADHEYHGELSFKDILIQ
jgi:hypothetical protein